MARIASQSQGGYYPTPPEEISEIVKRLRVQEGKQLNIIDPCAGTGHALRQIAEGLKAQGADVITYGVELEQQRAEEARRILDHVIHDGYENLRTEPKFSLMWLNPPYDDGFGERLEATFLRNLTGSKGVLEPNGLLLFCIPQHILKDVAGILASRFHDVKVFRFSDENYPTFKQVVVFARYGKPDIEEKKQISKYLKEVSAQGPEALIPLEKAEIIYEVYPSSDRVQIFRGRALKIDELAKDLADSPIFAEIERICTAKYEGTTLKNPMLPLKEMHYAIAIAANSVGGNMGSHILSGLTKRKVEIKDRYDDDGEVNGQEIIEYFRTVIRVFTPNGIFDLE